MSEIAIRSDAGALAVPSALDEGWADSLMAWAAAAQRAHEIATVLCETSFVPKSMQHRPGEVTGAILTGMELGVPIMWALSNIDIVEGAPAMRAKGLRALALRRGHEIWVEESTATRAVVCGRRKGSSRVERSTWTMDRAKKAELLGKKNWQRYPQDMLLNRATAEVVRMIAPDVLIGVSHTVDEMGGDETPDTALPVAEERQEPAPAPKRRTAQRAKPVPEVAPEDLPGDIPEPPQEPPPEPPPVVVPDEATAIRTMEAAGFEVIELPDDEQDAEAVREVLAEPMTDPQRKRMAVEMRKAGLIERAERLAFVSDILDREVETSSELTVSEASQVIQALVDLEGETERGLEAAQQATTGGA